MWTRSWWQAASPADPFYLEQQSRGVQILAIDRAMATEHFVTVASENQKASLDLTASCSPRPSVISP
jgi:hypothetical protein